MLGYLHIPGHGQGLAGHALLLRVGQRRHPRVLLQHTLQLGVQYCNASYGDCE